jgi:hypothetical protein
MAKAILLALDEPIDPGLLRTRGLAFSVEACATAYLSLFNELLRASAANGGRHRSSSVA